MSKREWNIYSSLAYFYNAFASLADGKLVEEETSKILEVLLGWTKQEDDDLKAMALFVVQAETWLNEDIDGSTDKKDLVNNSLNTCIEIVKEKLTKDQSKAVLIDLVKIGMADGNYDESEKGWVKMFADRLGIEPPVLPSEKSTEQQWTIIHDIGVFYMYFANLADHPDGDLKKDELDYILKVYPKWDITIDGVKYGFEHNNPSDLQETWDFIFSKMYDNGDPMPRINESHKNLVTYLNNGPFTASNLDTFVDTLYHLCMADGTISEGQKHQLIYYCEFFKSGSNSIKSTLLSLKPESAAEFAQDIFDSTEFDTEGRPIPVNLYEEREWARVEKTDVSDNTEVPKEKTVSRKKTKKAKPKKKLTLHEQLASELTKLYPTADVKKVDDGNYLDIHMPDIHSKRGTHIWFNTPKAGGIKVGFFCRDKKFIEDATKRNPSAIETYANGLRLSGHPTYNEVSDAMKAADEFVKMLKK
jgi:uncharacterized tellurite resistance protein B-like protein